jgi:hypothetical protein
MTDPLGLHDNVLGLNDYSLITSLWACTIRE